MRRLIGEYGMALLYCLIALTFISLVYTVFIQPDSYINSAIPNISEYEADSGTNTNLNELGTPVLTVKSKTIELNDEFNVNDFIEEATDEYGNDLKNTDRITYRGTVDVTTPGVYNLDIIMATDNFVNAKKVTIIVE